MDRESAISRNILMALVAAVAIIFVVIVAVFIFFPPQPDVVPLVFGQHREVGKYCLHLPRQRRSPPER